MINRTHIKFFTFFVILFISIFTYTSTMPITVYADDTDQQEQEDKSEKKRDKEEKKREKEDKKQEKQRRNKSQEEHDKDQDRRINQLEKDQKQGGILGAIDKVTSKIPVVGDVVDIATDIVGVVVPSKYCENNCGADNLPRGDSHAWTCKNSGHDKPVVVWECYTPILECPKKSEHQYCSSQNSHDKDRVDGNEGDENPDCTICWGSGACSTCGNTGDNPEDDEDTPEGEDPGRKKNGNKEEDEDKTPSCDDCTDGDPNCPNASIHAVDGL